jgi:hypothetical protein
MTASRSLWYVLFGTKGCTSSALRDQFLRFLRCFLKKFAVIPVSPKAKNGTKKAPKNKAFRTSAYVLALPPSQPLKINPQHSNPTGSAAGV